MSAEQQSLRRSILSYHLLQKHGTNNIHLQKHMEWLFSPQRQECEQGRVPPSQPMAQLRFGYEYNIPVSSPP